MAEFIDGEVIPLPKLPKLFMFLVMLGLVTSGLLLLIDLKIKNDLVATAMQWEERINERAQRFTQEELGNSRDNHNNGSVRNAVRMDVSAGMEEANVSELPTDKSNESRNSRKPAQQRPRASNTRVQPTDK